MAEQRTLTDTRLALSRTRHRQERALDSKDDQRVRELELDAAMYEGLIAGWKQQ